MLKIRETYVLHSLEDLYADATTVAQWLWWVWPPCSQWAWFSSCWHPQESLCGGRQGLWLKLPPCTSKQFYRGRTSEPLGKRVVDDILHLIIWKLVLCMKLIQKHDALKFLIKIDLCWHINMIKFTVTEYHVVYVSGTCTVNGYTQYLQVDVSWVKEVSWDAVWIRCHA